MARISVIGTGYLGVTHAACMASLGHDVVALDVDKDKVTSLAAGIVPFHEPGLPKLLKEALAAKKIHFTSDWTDVAAEADVHFLCVGTPQLPESSAADLSQIKSAISSLAPLLTKSCLIVGKSTVPVGTAKWISEYLIANSPAGKGVHLVWNPEFLREGFAVEDTLYPDRIVLGIQNKEDISGLTDIYASALDASTPLVVTDYATAELVKVAANAFLATKISFINAFAYLADEVGADVGTLADAIGHDTRIGRRFLNAGIGFGGGCLPKDIRALQARASELGLSEHFEFLKNVDEVNKSRRNYVVELARKTLETLDDKTITILGAAFKPDSDDLRDSPALGIALALSKAGANI
ncbi:MAG: UDP-glucose/GDP-mannose dehydrogenase family protein, partial [Actinobacteria bacterium]|nr:UDP-glucose/GDP-mannose dehydrogenase family protein [Actinomycetota bacterium]